MRDNNFTRKEMLASYAQGYIDGLTYVHEILNELAIPMIKKEAREELLATMQTLAREIQEERS